MIRLLDRFCRHVETIASILLALAALLVVASTLSRYAFTWPIPDSFDISRLMIGACIMWGFASVGYRGGHISVDLFSHAMSPRWRKVIDIIAWSLMLVFVLAMVWKMFGRVVSARASNEATFDLRILVWPMLAVIWAGAAASVVTIAMRIWLLATTPPADTPEQTETGHGL